MSREVIRSAKRRARLRDEVDGGRLELYERMSFDRFELAVFDITACAVAIGALVAMSRRDYVWAIELLSMMLGACVFAHGHWRRRHRDWLQRYRQVRRAQRALDRELGQ